MKGTIIQMSDLSALIVAYRRYSNLESIVSLCINGGISRIYISADGSKDSSDYDDVVRVAQEIERLQLKNPEIIVANVHHHNLGAAANVLRSCDWIFGQEDFVTILEDDCIPSPSFFDFVRDCREELLKEDQVYLICGSQFAPIEITRNLSCLSIYPMVWGWATTRSKWISLTDQMCKDNFAKFNFFKIESSDKTFWRAGARRAFEGYIDAWDIPLVKAVRDLNGNVLVAGANLVSNIGGDDLATHTVSGSKWLYSEIGEYIHNSSKVTHNTSLDRWISKSLFGINAFHQFSTRATFIIDKLRINRTKRGPLLPRWKPLRILT